MNRHRLIERLGAAGLAVIFTIVIAIPIITTIMHGLQSVKP